MLHDAAGQSFVAETRAMLVSTAREWGELRLRARARREGARRHTERER
jgi:hypothetical protein